jgi:hypothetical protein
MPVVPRVQDAPIFVELEAPHPILHMEDASQNELPVEPSVPTAPGTLPRFSHTPPSTVRGRARWPISLESQAIPMDQRPCLQDILIWVQPYLETWERQKLRCTAVEHSLGPDYGPLWFYRPWSPNRRRRWGFGIPSTTRTVVNDTPPPHIGIHFAWRYLTPSERYITTQTCSQWFLYHRLRVKAVSLPIANLRLKRPPPTKPTRLPADRALQYSCAMLRFSFYYGDFIRWMGGEYTNRHRDWDATFDTIERRRERPPTQGLPPVDLPRGKAIFTQGVPLQGHFTCPQADIAKRNRYNNHPAISENYAAVEAKFAKEEQKSFHVHMQRFLVYFIVGLLLNPLQWEWDKGKGRICVDGTGGPDGPDTAGSCNTHIPKPSVDNPDECPPVYYSTALMRFLVAIWRYRITHPDSDLLLHADDLDSAFRRILYSPEMAILFAYVFGEYLIIPVGQVFGSRSAPSFFSLESDIRADLATTGTLVEHYPIEQLAAEITLPPPPEVGTLSPAIADAMHGPLTIDEQACFHNASFVDDNGICATRENIVHALHQSLVAAFILFGWPHQDRRSSCMAADKWEIIASHVVLFLGYYINSRTLMVTWPLYKRVALHADIQLALQAPNQVPPKVAASIMGKVRAAGEIAPWGPYISFSLATAIKNASRRAFHPTRRWWTKGRITFTQEVINDLLLLCESLNLPEFSPVWSCNIGLLISRIATHKFLSDASYEGLGGWSPDFQVQWRLTRADLLEMGFNLKVVNAVSGEPNADELGLHINPLEFIAVIINLWLFLCLIKTQKRCPTGYILDLLSDNTSALSWMHFTATTRNPLLQPLARFASALLIQARSYLTRVQPCHIPGVINDEADALSRYQNGRLKSFEDVITRCSLLRTCRICLLPRRLLSVLADLSSSRPIVGTYASLTTSLLTHEVSFLPDGCNLRDIQSSLLQR